MKRILCTVSGMMLLMIGVAYAETEMPVIDEPQMNQERRIDRGVESGQLNKREANRLNNQQEPINRMKNKAKSDGVMTKNERARISEAQDHASRHIASQKHDRKGKRHR